MSDEIKYLTKEQAALKLLQGETIVWQSINNNTLCYELINGNVFFNSFEKWPNGPFALNGAPEWTFKSKSVIRECLLTLPDYEKLRAQKKAEAGKKISCCECGRDLTAEQRERNLKIWAIKNTCFACYEKKLTKKQSKLEKFITSGSKWTAICRDDLPELIEIIKEELGR